MDTPLTVILKVYPNVEDAELAQQFLATYGIASFIQIDSTGGLQVSSSPTVGVVLMVFEVHLEKAQEILQLHS